MSVRVYKRKTWKTYLYLGIKRLFDILISLLGLILLLPLTLIIKLFYIITGDFHSIFLPNHIRVGKNGKEFRLYKFRSMVPDADKEPLKKLLEDPKYKAEWDKNQKFENDPRVTKIGKIIRHGSIDEFPQFLNVLKGDLSLIGPRPLIPGEIEKHHGDKKKYWSVKPGITGWWAVNGRSATTYKKRFELEYYYVDHQSLLLDLKIFFKTFTAVITKKGAK